MSWLARSKPRSLPWVPITSCARSTNCANSTSSSNRRSCGKVNTSSGGPRTPSTPPSRCGRAEPASSVGAGDGADCGSGRPLPVLIDRPSTEEVPVSVPVEHDWFSPGSGTSCTKVDATGVLRRGAARICNAVHSIASPGGATKTSGEPNIQVKSDRLTLSGRGRGYTAPSRYTPPTAVASNGDDRGGRATGRGPTTGRHNSVTERGAGTRSRAVVAGSAGPT